MERFALLAATLALVALPACKQPAPAKNKKAGKTSGAATTPGAVTATPLQRYQLVCDSSDTPKVATLFCMRHDTATGDVKRVAVKSLPLIKGPSSGAAQAPGTYDLRCHATRAENASDLFCLRLNTITGAMALIALPKMGIVPPGAKHIPMVTTSEAGHSHSHGPAPKKPKTSANPTGDKHSHGGATHSHSDGSKPHKHPKGGASKK